MTRTSCVRRRGASYGLAVLVAILSWAFGRGPAPAQEAAGAAAAERRPNVLFIAVDDLNDWVSALGGHPQCKTPNIDRLAARGTLFTRAYCSAPACNPSRASLLTGIAPSTSGVYHNPDPWRRALPDATTLPQHFWRHGYDAVGGGKIFHGAFEDPASWRSYFARPADPRPEKRPVNGLARTAHFDWGPVDVPDERMGDHAVVDWAIDYLGERRSRPFFLAVGLYRPHLPWYVPRRYFERHPEEKVVLPTVRSDDLDDVPEAGRKMAKPDGDHRRVLESGNWRRAVQGYLASVEFADREIGRLIEALDASGHAGDTIVVLWGDHGWHLGEKSHWRKFALWEEATRVPLLVVAPGTTKAATRCERTVSLLDLYPTLVELCQLPTRPELEGRSLVPLLRDPQAAWGRPAVTTHGRGNHSVRSERWRYIRYADGSEELYDHSVDPNEWTNLASRAEHAEVKADLARWLPAGEAEPVKKPARRSRSAQEEQR